MREDTGKNRPKGKILRIATKSVLYLILFILILFLLLQTGPVQNFLKDKVVVFLEKKLETRLTVRKLKIDFPNSITLQDVYLEDKATDTLLAGTEVRANINLWQLIFNNRVNIKSIALEGIILNLKRHHADSFFNYQFVLNAFTPNPDTLSPADTTAMAIDLQSVELNNVQLAFLDEHAGMDATVHVGHLDSRFREFNPQKMIYNFPRTRIDRLTANIHQVKPLASPEPSSKDVAEARNPDPLQLIFENADLQNVYVAYRNDVSGINSSFKVGYLSVTPNEIDLGNRTIAFEKLVLHNAVSSVKISDPAEARVIAQEAEKELEVRADAGWKLYIDEIDIQNNTFGFDNETQPRLKNAVDYAHLLVDSFNLQATDIILKEDTIAGNISRASFKEQSGFVLDQLQTSFIYTDREASLENLYLKTPRTELRRKAAIRYASISSLVNDIGNMYIDLDLDDSRLYVKDLLSFVPSLRLQPAFANPGTVWYINSRIHGRLSSLQIDQLNISGLNDTYINIAGTLNGLPEMKNVYADLNIHEVRSSKRDILLFMPASSLPKNLTLPANFSLSGTLDGNGNAINTNLGVFTSLGNARVNGTFSELTDINAIRYNINIQASRLQVGTLFRLSGPVGALSGSFRMKGKGLKPSSANMAFSGNVHSFHYDGYNYRNLLVSGDLVKSQLAINADMNDPNLDFKIVAQADLSGKYPSLEINGMIDSMKLQALNLADEKMILRTGISGNFINLNPDDLAGHLYLTQALFVHEDRRLQMDTVEMVADRTDNGNFLELKSDVMYAKLEGRYKLTQMSGIIQNSIKPYFSIQTARPANAPSPYDFTLNAYIVDNPVLRIFDPKLERIDSVTLSGHFSSTAGLTASLSAPEIKYGPHHIRNLEMDAAPGTDNLLINASVEQFNSGKNIQLHNTSLRAMLANNTMEFVVNSRDAAKRNKYNIGGTIIQPSPGLYQLSLANDSLLLNYDRWTVNAGNTLTFGNGAINAGNVVLEKNGERLVINSTSMASNAPLDINFNNFRLGTLTGFVQTDSTFANGLMNGRISFTNFSGNPVFTSDMTIADFSYKGDTVGNVHLLVNNRTAATYATELTLTGRGNDLRMTGNYFPERTGNNFDFDLDVRRLPMATVEAFSNNAIQESNGHLTGRLKLSGSFTDPDINGDITFNGASFNLTALNTHFQVDNEKVTLNDQGITLNRFVILDSARNELVLDGNIRTTNYSDFNFDLDITADNFRALNTTKRQDALFYGQLYFDTDLKVKGSDKAPFIDGNLVVNEQTRMTIVLPQREVGIVEREGVIEFVDMDAPINDSLFLAPYDSLNMSGFRGMDIAVNIEVNRLAEFNLIVDEGNGDFINAKGEALLTAGIDPSGKINLSGSYELDEGAYQLTFNFLRRKFDIQKGSRIVWEGAPTDATVNVEAIYVANTSPLDLVKNQIGEASEFDRNTYLQKLPFDVHLFMEGPLLQPQIRFDIKLPEKSYVVSSNILATIRTRLEQLRQEPGEMNKQVFSLLLLNRFIDENPFSSSTGGISPGTFARQSVSKLLTEQLNRLAGDLLGGVGLNFDIISAEDYTTGQRRDRTDLNVAFTKKLLNDRLTVKIGSNFELEGPAGSNYQGTNIAGDIAVDYRISRDNRYMLRFYRRNEYEGVIDGYIIETGVGFLITVDYNRFSEIFLSKDERKQRRERRKINRTERRMERRADREAAKEPLTIETMPINTQSSQ